MQGRVQNDKCHMSYCVQKSASYYSLLMSFPGSPFIPFVPFRPGSPCDTHTNVIMMVLVIQVYTIGPGLPRCPGVPGGPSIPLSPGGPVVPFIPGSPILPIGPGGPSLPVVPLFPGGPESPLGPGGPSTPSVTRDYRVCALVFLFWAQKQPLTGLVWSMRLLNHETLIGSTPSEL